MWVDVYVILIFFVWSDSLKGSQQFDKAQWENKLHMWKAFSNMELIWLWMGIAYHRGTLFYFFVFLKRNTPDIKHHIGEDHRNFFQPYHNPQQPRLGFCFSLSTSFKLKVWTTSHQTQNLGRAQGVTRHKKGTNRATIHHLNREKLHMLTTHTGKQVNIFWVFKGFANFYLILVMQILWIFRIL